MSPTTVLFAGAVASRLPRELQAKLETELAALFAQPRHAGQKPPQQIWVSQLFAGYRTNLEQKIVLGVELRFDPGYETAIVKLGHRDKVARDYTGWESCTNDRQVCSRIFSPVVHQELPNDRIAVLYRDAYTLFGLDPDKSRPESLERVAEWSIRDERPDPLSVERVISNLYTDLGRWFFPGASADAERARKFYRAKLGESVEAQWHAPERETLRRDAVWLLCGNDRPDAEPLVDPPRYLDPLEFVLWTLDSPARIPSTLVGRTHGDLHGRNVLLGVRRGEAEYPAVFDYGDMGPNNVLAWDFAKLEMELKVRLLPNLLQQDSAARQWLLDQSRLKAVKSRPTLPRSLTRSGQRSQMLAACLAFEELFHERTTLINSHVAAESLRPLSAGPSLEHAKLERLLSILLRIRREAALWLGYESPGRCQLWLDEYYLALAVYGLINVKWDYEWPQAECALVAAGVAAARMPSTPTKLAEALQVESPSGRALSYRVPLAHIHRCWKKRQLQEARSLVEQEVLKVEVDDSTGARTKIEVRTRWKHSVPLVAESALIEIEQGDSRLAEPLLESLRPTARELCDYETLGRIGRLFKDSGDQRWQEAETPFSQLRGMPAWQMYTKAFTIYEEAFLATEDYYPGINAATLALLTDETRKSREYALRVADTCRNHKDIPRAERFWVFATEGEAALLLGDFSNAVKFYEQSLAELSPGQLGMADSAFKQVCRLRCALGKEVQAVVNLFSDSQFKFDREKALLKKVWDLG